MNNGKGTKVVICNENQTETGTPVQFLQWMGDRWRILPAVIAMVDEVRVDVIILGTGGLLYENAIHEDFKKEGKHYWRHLPKKEGGQFKNEIWP